MAAEQFLPPGKFETVSVTDITFNSQRHMHSRNKRLHATRSDAPHAPGAAMGPPCLDCAQAARSGSKKRAATTRRWGRAFALSRHVFLPMTEARSILSRRSEREGGRERARERENALPLGKAPLPC